MNKNRIKGEVALYSTDYEDGQIALSTAPVNHHKAYYEAIFKAMQISAAKNHDYAGGEDKDPLANFKRVEAAGVEPIVGLVVRMLDKVGRIETFMREGKLLVPGETVEDAFSDLGNYCFLAIALMEDMKNENK